MNRFTLFAVVVVALVSSQAMGQIRSTFPSVKQPTPAPAPAPASTIRPTFPSVQSPPAVPALKPGAGYSIINPASVVGTWYCNGKPCSISAQGAGLVFQNEVGQRVTGTQVNTVTLECGWMHQGKRLRGTITVGNGVMVVQWANGARWTSVAFPYGRLSGVYYMNGRPCRVSEANQQITFINEHGNKVDGRWVTPTTVFGWGMNATLVPEPDGRVGLKWGNGTYWTSIAPPKLTGPTGPTGPTTGGGGSGTLQPKEPNVERKVSRPPGQQRTAYYSVQNNEPKPVEVTLKYTYRDKNTFKWIVSYHTSFPLGPYAEMQFPSSPLVGPYFVEADHKFEITSKRFTSALPVRSAANGIPGQVASHAAPDFNLAPTYGSVSLKAGFLPDPFVRALTAGGNIRTNLGGVNAFVAKAPDFKLQYAAGRYPLTIRVESTADTTLLIRLPNGAWIANDDSGGGLNPKIRLPQPQSGRYDIYVGTYGSSLAPARLIITERE